MQLYAFFAISPTPLILYAGASFGQLGPSLGSTLKSLAILGCRHLGDCALEGISGLTQLTFLQLEDCSSLAYRRHGVGDTGGPFTDVGLARLASLTKLTAVSGVATAVSWRMLHVLSYVLSNDTSWDIW